MKRHDNFFTKILFRTMENEKNWRIDGYHSEIKRFKVFQMPFVGVRVDSFFIYLEFPDMKFIAMIYLPNKMMLWRWFATGEEERKQRKGGKSLRKMTKLCQFGSFNCRESEDWMNFTNSCNSSCWSSGYTTIFFFAGIRPN